MKIAKKYETDFKKLLEDADRCFLDPNILLPAGKLEILDNLENIYENELLDKDNNHLAEFLEAQYSEILETLQNIKELMEQIEEASPDVENALMEIQGAL